MDMDTLAPAASERAEARNCMSPKLNRQMMRALDELEFRADVALDALLVLA
jgi:trans-feruloyl-CoA hydratase/vanillin synthase